MSPQRSIVVTGMKLENTVKFAVGTDIFRGSIGHRSGNHETFS